MGKQKQEINEEDHEFVTELKRQLGEGWKDEVRKSLRLVKSSGSQAFDADAFERELDELLIKDAPVLPETFSRADIYFDHD